MPHIKCTCRSLWDLNEIIASSVFYQTRPPSPPVPLPCVPGPKLAPFTRTAYADDIEFIQFLGRENDVDSLVWKVKINKAGPFVLKVFYFWHWDFLRRNQGGDLTRRLASPQLYVDYFDPFNCECRAYGRLKQEKREDLAVRALGYLLFNPQQEIDLAQKVEGRSTPPPSANATTMDGDFWGWQEQHRGLPVRAIVKDLVASKAPDPAQDAGLWLDLQALHSLGIFVKDTHGGNYLNGKLVDFSRSWTMYHPALDQIDAYTLRSLMLDELQHLLDYYCDGANDSTAYNWLKWETNADAAKAYVEQELFERTPGAAVDVL
ncbi:kinetochore Sim4 complex subunit FTA2-domain-containing protein [Dichotomopilus funicola]|uniref:Kinetochore Sim4 complex subunit FTA2-domain-containing protein n=1 Tax=Dichotomopilus funicola TaxID=1934379 RepID=A0AAN6VA85_9PEZI|nr:kinetochore Sim4 complex subunit FTA2-domain-containing protein [Dichotomopilus funicola]